MTPPRDAKGLDIEGMIGGLLLAGLLASIGCIAAGLVWHWAATGTLHVDQTLPATSLAAFLVADARTVASGHAGPRRLIDVGIGILLVTPYLRVLASMLYFLVVGNRKYTVFTAIVLALLTWGLSR